MATSGSYDFNLDRDGLIGEAYRYVGATAIGETPTTDELTDGGRTLNLMLKGWQTEGIHLWLNQKVTLYPSYGTKVFSLGSTGGNATPSSGAVKTELAVAGVVTDSTIDVDSITGMTTGDYIGIELDDNTVQWTTINGAPSGVTVTLTTALTGVAAIDNHVYTYTNKIQRPLEIIEARRVAASGNQTPLLQYSREEYMGLSNKSSVGTMTQFYYDPQLDNGLFHIWPTNGDVQDTIEMTIKKPIMDFDASTDDGEFPVEWTDAIVMNLAIRVSIKMGLPVDKDLKELASMTKFMASTNDREPTSTYFQPNHEG